MEQLKALSLHEKLSYFYCAYVREETVDRETDAEAIRLWDKISISRRKCRERVGYLLQQIENVSSSHVRHLDSTFKAKRELVLLAEGTIRSTTSSAPSSSTGGILHQLDAARINNELLQECGALSVFAHHLQRSLHAFRSLNFQQLDVDQLDRMTHDLQQDMVLMYLLILFNANRKNTAAFDRELFVLGTAGPSYAFLAIIDCLVQLHVLPGFPIKRLLMLFVEWFSAVLGDTATLDKIKSLRKSHHDETDPTWLDAEKQGRSPCKSFDVYADTVALDPQDPYYLQKLKFAKVREQIHRKYKHRPHSEMPSHTSTEAQLSSASLELLDDEWQSRCEEVYRLFLSRMHDLSSFLSNLVILSSGSALNARDKKTFYSRRPSAAEQLAYGIDFNSQFDGAPNMGESGDNQYWKWIMREKLVVLDVATLLILLLFKQFRCSHVCKGEYVMHFFLDANLMGTLTKFMNKDLATYLQAARQDTSEELKTGFYALENELRKLIVESDDKQSEFAVQSTRTITSILRILQKMTKRKPNVIKNALCRTSSIVWLKRVVSLNVAVPHLYALKLVKSQARYLGHQWVRKYTCFNLLTDVYLYVRPELNDNWLDYEDDDPTKPPAGNSQDSVERLLFGEMQAYHHKYYWEVLGSKPLPANASLIVEADKELSLDAFDVEGGRLARFFNELKLEPVQFCQQYEKWLDQEKLASDGTAVTAPLPIF